MHAGKSTVVKMLSEKYGLIMCGENYHNEVTDLVADPAIQPDLCYIRQLKDWKESVKRSPETVKHIMMNMLTAASLR